MLPPQINGIQYGCHYLSGQITNSEALARHRRRASNNVNLRGFKNRRREPRRRLTASGNRDGFSGAVHNLRQAVHGSLRTTGAGA